jgi:hypothetical protein
VLAAPADVGHLSRDATDHAEREALEATAAARRRAAKRAYVRRVFSEIAPRYDLLNHLLSLNVDRAWRRAALAELAWERRPDGTYLDLCAGTLDVGALLARRPGFRGLVVGADFRRADAPPGRRKAPAYALAPVAADAQALPMADASVDGAIVAFGIRNVADLDVALGEARPRARAGGAARRPRVLRAAVAARARALPRLLPPRPPGGRPRGERAPDGVRVPARVGGELSHG